MSKWLEEHKWAGVTQKAFKWGLSSAAVVALILYLGTPLYHAFQKRDAEKPIQKTEQVQNNEQPQSQTPAQNIPTQWQQDEGFGALDMTRTTTKRVLMKGPEAGDKTKYLYLDVQPNARGGPEVGTWGNNAQFGVNGTMPANMPVLPGKYYLMELTLDPISKKWSGKLSEVDASKVDENMKKRMTNNYVRLSDGERIATTTNSVSKGGDWNMTASGYTVVVGRDEAK